MVALAINHGRRHGQPKSVMTILEQIASYIPDRIVVKNLARRHKTCSFSAPSTNRGNAPCRWTIG